MNQGQFEVIVTELRAINAKMTELVNNSNETRLATNRVDGRLKEVHGQVTDERIQEMIEERLIQVLKEAAS